MKTFPIVTDTHYGWRTGITDTGELAIVDVYQDLFFDSDGRYLRMDYYCDWHDYSPEKTKNFEDRLAKIIAIPSPIFVQEFEIPEHGISLRQIPKRYEAYLTNPTKLSAEDQDFMKGWINDGFFEFRFNNDFWMDPDGTVNSS